MNRFVRMLVCVALLSLAAVSSIASAANYSLWINGRGAGGVVGDYNSFTYWGPAGTAAGVNKRAVNWDGYNSIASQNGKIRDALDCFCTGANWCYIATQSAGDLMIGYTLANYGGSARMKKNAAPNASGVCGNADGTSQAGWNIRWVLAAAGAAGGSELSDAGSWTTGKPLVRDLKTSTARAMYNHNSTRSVWFYMFAGASGTVYSSVLPGQDDETIAYHSSGAVSGTAGSAYCNPRDWWCNDLTMGTAINEGGWPKWSYHTVFFRDDQELYSHSNRGNWAGIVARMTDTMVSSAL